MSFSWEAVKGTVTPPPSKSHTHRAFLLSSLSSRTCDVTNALNSYDTAATLNAVKAMGTDVKRMCGKVRITGGELHAPAGIVDADNSGTTMRLFTGIASMFDSPVTITGDASLRTRPMGPLLDALTEMGVRCTSADGKAPLTVHGPNMGGNVNVRGDVSSQFISSLMMVAPMLPNDTNILIKGDISSRPYVDITASMMSRFGAHIAFGDNKITVTGGTGYDGCNIRVPADLSSAAFPLTAGALGGSVTVKGIDMDDPQGDKRIIDILKVAGADVSVKGNEVSVSSGPLNGSDVNMKDIPDLFPIVAALLSTAKGRSVLHGAPQLKFKESDRIESTVNMLKALGADIEGTEDGCVINGVRRLNGGTIDHREDHRILMASVVASLVCENEVSMVRSRCYDVSYPLFLEQMKKLGMNAEV